MIPMLETLEGRRLLAGQGGAGLVDRWLDRAEAAADDRAVQATVALLRADRDAVDAARQRLIGDSSDTRKALKATLTIGFDLLAADRQAIRDSAGDPAAQEAARDKLKADRQQLRADLAAARDALRTDTVEARAALADAVSSLKDHLRQLRTDLQNADAAPNRPPTSPPESPPATGADPARPAGEPAQAPPAGPRRTFSFTPEQAAEAVNALNEIAAKVDGIDRAAVDVLAGHLVSAASDSELARDERRQLLDDGRAVLRSLSFSDLRTIARDVRDVLDFRPTQA